MAGRASGGGGRIILPILNVSSDITLTANQVKSYQLFSLTNAADTADVTVTLPPYADIIGYSVELQKVDSTTNNIIIDGDGSETIQGYSSITLDCQYARLKLLATSSGWVVLDHFFTDKQYTPTLSGGNWSSTNYARVKPYRGLDGVWWLTGALDFNHSTSTTPGADINGVTFAAGAMHVSASDVNGIASTLRGYTSATSPDVNATYSGTSNRTNMSFDLPLASKPTFVA